MKYKKGSKAFIVESNHTIREVIILRVTSDFYVVRFKDIEGAIQIRGSRLFASEEEACAMLPQQKRKKRTGYRSPHEYWH